VLEHELRIGISNISGNYSGIAVNSVAQNFIYEELV
jgi:hypothetical protein